MNKEEIKEILDNLIINETTGMCYLSIRLTNQTRNIITNLQKENERLKQFLFESINNTNKGIELIEIYRLRCEKAIKYIESINCYGMRSGKTLLQKYLYDLLNILMKGEENNIPEKLSTWFSLEKDCENDNIQFVNINFERMYEKINEIIDCLKSKESDEK